MSDKVKSVGRHVADTLGKLETLFSKDVNLSFLMTDPKNPACYMVITNEDPDILIAAINASRNPAITENDL